MRKLIVTGVLAALLAPRAASAEILERIVGVVNDDVILQSELKLRVVAAEDELDELKDPVAAAERRRQLEDALLDSMIAEQLIAQQAAELKLKVTNAEVDKALDEVRKQNKVTAEQLERALREEGFTMAQYRSDVKRQILRLKVINVAVRSRIQISDTEIQEAYERKQRQGGATSEVRASHIFIEVPDTADQAVVHEAQGRAEALAVRAKGGEDFAAMAKAVSEDPATKEDGGDLGWIGHGMLPGELDKVLFEMKVGEVRGPLLGESGFHIMKLTDTRKKELKPLAEIKEKLREELYQAELKRQTKNWIDELRKKAYIKRRPTLADNKVPGGTDTKAPPVKPMPDKPVAPAASPSPSPSP